MVVKGEIYWAFPLFYGTLQVLYHQIFSTILGWRNYYKLCLTLMMVWFLWKDFPYYSLVETALHFSTFCKAWSAFGNSVHNPISSVAQYKGLECQLHAISTPLLWDLYFLHLEKRLLTRLFSAEADIILRLCLLIF